MFECQKPFSFIFHSKEMDYCLLSIIIVCCINWLLNSNKYTLKYFEESFHVII